MLSDIDQLLQKARTAVAADLGKMNEDLQKQGSQIDTFVKALPAAIKPIRTDASQTLFQSARRNFNFFLPISPGIEQRISFQDGFLATADERLVAYIKKEFPSMVSVLEDGALSPATVAERASNAAGAEDIPSATGALAAKTMQEILAARLATATKVPG